jgi:RsmE family RNA methyltransferase
VGNGIIKELDRRKPYKVKLKVILNKMPEAAAPLDILLALPRPVVFKRIIRHLTTLGVQRVFVVNAAKVEKSYWQSSVVTEDGWRRYVREGLEQAVDTRLVDVTFHRGFRPFIQEVIPEIKYRYAQMLVAHPESTGDVTSIYKAGKKPALLAIGPEGGWNEYELEQMRTQGFDRFSLGSRILGVETAVTAVHASITLLRSQTT